MSLGTVFFTLLIKPLELVFEIIYSIANSVIVNPGLSIVALSLTMNFLVLPLYMRADALQMEEQDREKKLKFGTTHIKKTFKGDERFMMLQAYYRENDYKPIYALRGSFSLLLEIPFFISAYHFLSHLELIKGVSFGPIVDLGAPDSIINIAGLSINLLPILMTVINLISSMIYAKDSPLKTKVQLIAVALVFLVFLYKSPSGLVFYWTLNNLFSLIKNIFYKLKNPRKVLCIISSCAGILAMAAVLLKKEYSIRQRVILLFLCALLQLPIILSKLKLKNKDNVSYNNNVGLFICAALYVATLVGGLITSQVIAASTAEFVSITNLYNPLIHVANSFLLAVGLFVIWLGIFYYLSDKKGRAVFGEVAVIIAMIASIDYMFFGTKLGNLSPRLQFDNLPSYSIQECLINAAVIVAVIVVVHFIYKKNDKILLSVLFAGIIAISFMSIKNVSKINNEYAKIEKNVEQANELPTYTFSKNGKNVVVLMMDRMVSSFVPYIINEKPELMEEFDGFTYYPNCMSYASTTNVGLPGLLGGYEYTPEEMNKREDESLVEKHNEALKVMPVLFDQNDYNVTVCDPTYANYGWIPDLSIYDDYPDIKKYITMGNIPSNDLSTGDVKGLLNRNAFCYGIFKICPVFIQPSVYNNGNYFSTKSINTEQIEATVQVKTSLYQATGVDAGFIDSYNVLNNMIGMTRIEKNDENHFLVMCNELTHHPCLLQEPDYEPSMEVDNRSYSSGDSVKYDSEGNKILLDNDNKITHYHVDMKAMLELGEWFKYLKEQGVYDNTKIIIASDHGWPTECNSMWMDGGKNAYGQDIYDLETFNCTLMVKDFNSKGFVEDNTFMTNADVPVIATNDTISDPINPFTGNKIDDSMKKQGEQHVQFVERWEIDVNNGNTFMPAAWYSVHDDVKNMDNWKSLGYY